MNMEDGSKIKIYGKAKQDIVHCLTIIEDVLDIEPLKLVEGEYMEIDGNTSAVIVSHENGKTVINGMVLTDYMKHTLIEFLNHRI